MPTLTFIIVCSAFLSQGVLASRTQVHTNIRSGSKVVGPRAYKMPNTEDRPLRHLKGDVGTIGYPPGEKNHDRVPDEEGFTSFALTRMDNKHSSVHGGRTKRALTANTLTADEIAAAVTKHNDLRVMAGAANMFEMSWDSVLADLAQTWANRCGFDHGQPPEAESVYNLPSIGQNLWAGSNPNGQLNIPGRIQSWYNEVDDYNYDTGACSGNACGHYTQVMWRNSYKVGCAMVSCPVVYYEGGDHSQGEMIPDGGRLCVCNYYVAGNYAGVKPFYKGTACSQCDDLLPLAPDDLVTSQCCTDAGLCRPNCAETLPALGESTATTTTTTTTTTTSPTTTTTSATTTTTSPTTTTTTTSPTTTTTSATTTTTTSATTTTTGPTTTTTTSPTTTTASPTTTTTTSPTTTTTSPTTTTTTSPTTTTTTSPTTTTTTSPTTTTSTSATTTTTPTTTTPTTTTTTTTTTPSTTTTTPTTTTTTPTTTTSTPTTTTTTPTTTTTTSATTTTTTAGTCPACMNSGSVFVSGGECNCACTSNWQGPTCAENRQEVSLSINLYFNTYNAGLWPLLQSILAGAANSYCSESSTQAGSCCSVTPSSSFRPAGLAFTFSSNVYQAQGSPTSVVHATYGAVERVMVLLAGAPNNALCTAARGSVGRRKREVDLDAAIPQDTLNTIVNNAQAEIQSQAQTLGVSLLEVAPAQQLPAVQVPDNSPPSWAVATAAAVILLLVAIPLAIYVVYINTRRKTIHQSKLPPVVRHSLSDSHDIVYRSGPHTWSGVVSYPWNVSSQLGRPFTRNPQRGRRLNTRQKMAPTTLSDVYYYYDY